MANILVSQYTQGMAYIDPIVFRTPEEAGKYIAEHNARRKEIMGENNAIRERTRENGYRSSEWQKGLTNIDVRETTAAPGQYRDAVDLDKQAISKGNMDRIKKSVTEAEEQIAARAANRAATHAAGDVLEGVAHNARRFGVVGKVAGAAVAGTMAMASGANAAEIGKESINAVAPGAGTLILGEGPRRGNLCEAFGQATGAVAGIGAGLGVGALTSWTGPGAVVAGGAAGLATEAAATPAATWACNKLSGKLGF